MFGVEPVIFGLARVDENTDDDFVGEVGDDLLDVGLRVLIELLEVVRLQIQAVQRVHRVVHSRAEEQHGPTVGREALRR